MMVLISSIKDRLNPEQAKSSSLRATVYAQSLKWIVLATLLTLLLLGHAFGREWWKRPPPEGPHQIWSKVEYDPNLTDTFFLSEEWNYRHMMRYRPGNPNYNGPKSQDRIKRTAMVFSNSMGGGDRFHLVEFCEARVIDGDRIVLWIYNGGPGYLDKLYIWVRNGMFTTRFRDAAASKKIPSVLSRPKQRKYRKRWTPKRQKLILDRKNYRKGDEIRGRIDLEYIEELFSSPAHIIKVYGVFKAIVK